MYGGAYRVMITCVFEHNRDLWTKQRKKTSMFYTLQLEQNQGFTEIGAPTNKKKKEQMLSGVDLLSGSTYWVSQED